MSDSKVELGIVEDYYNLLKWQSGSAMFLYLDIGADKDKPFQSWKHMCSGVHKNRLAYHIFYIGIFISIYICILLTLHIYMYTDKQTLQKYPT